MDSIVFRLHKRMLAQQYEKILMIKEAQWKERKSEEQVGFGPKNTQGSARLRKQILEEDQSMLSRIQTA